MQIKFSEKNLIIGIITVAIGLILLINSSLITTAVQVSEKGLIYTIIACITIAIGIRSIRRSIRKI